MEIKHRKSIDPFHTSKKQNKRKQMTNNSNTPTFAQQLNQCSFDQWYPLFYNNKHNHGHLKRTHLTFPSTILRLDPTTIISPTTEQEQQTVEEHPFVQYLKRDGIKLPSNNSKGKNLKFSIQEMDEQENDESDEWSENEDDENDENDDDVWSENSDTAELDRQFQLFKQKFSHNENSENVENSDNENSEKSKNEENDQDEQDEQETKILKHEKFLQVLHHIETCLSQYDGALFPKMNWSCPRDAQWILTDSKFLKCCSVDDVLLVLKSSQFIVHDLEKAYANANDEKIEEKVEEKIGEIVGEKSEEKVHFVLVCRRWYDLEPSMEFRCFIKRGQLVGISQRNTLQYFEFLSKERYSFLEPLLIDFWTTYVKGVFPLESYTMDVYIQRHRVDLAKSLVYIVDFNVYGEPTDPLLFESWHEPSSVLSLSEKAAAAATTTTTSVIFRLVESSQGTIKPSFTTYGGVPSDLYDPTIRAQMKEHGEEKEQQMESGADGDGDSSASAYRDYDDINQKMSSMMNEFFAQKK